MIGVIADPREYPVVREFFELFKTPWEFYRSDRSYDVLLCSGESRFQAKAAKLVLRYSSQTLESEAGPQSEISARQNGAGHLCYRGIHIPIYGNSLQFSEEGGPSTTTGPSGLYVSCADGTVHARIGYDLFHEVEILLTKGQPAANAGSPTLELHIALLRRLMLESGVALIEIPPVPHGYRFVACLTHDVDHPAIRFHRFDHTVFGFLYRAILGSLIDVVKGNKGRRDLRRNWAAALKLPFVHLGLARDFWCTFEQYVSLEHGLPSTFFVIPFKDKPGRQRRGSAPGPRASGYGADDIAGPVRELMTAGCEVGLHGIDAWLDSSSGKAELEEVRKITRSREVGVRMHWLYYDEQSPAALDRAGVDYDSTVGYNETIGYRAGTTQAYKPLDTAQLLELPLHVMDTALFFPGYLHLSTAEALQRISGILDNAVEFGGSVTVNWHDRSIAPERLWGDVYGQLIRELEGKGAWFATASQAVSWFRKRRSAVFQDVSWDAGALKATIAVTSGKDLPDLEVRVYEGLESYRTVVIGVPVSGDTNDCSSTTYTVQTCAA